MRITGGQLRGRVLETPPDDRLRPTQERVRQALYNILGSHIEGASFLDLFAGTGAVGIEAWSRGAATVTLVESGRDVLPFLMKNVKNLCPETVSIWKGTSEQYIKSSGKGAAYDFIYADPPYGSRHSPEGRAVSPRPPSGARRREPFGSAQDRPHAPDPLGDDPRLAIVHQSLNTIYMSTLLKPGGMVIWECRSDMKLDAGDKWNLLQKREYGGTTLFFLNPRPVAPGHTAVDPERPA